MSKPVPADELRCLYPPILTTVLVAEMMHCTSGDVRDMVHRKDLPAMRWGQQFRFIRDEVIAAMVPMEPEQEQVDDEEQPEETQEDEA